LWLRFRLAEEQACAGYLTARAAMVRWAGRAVSLGRLAAEQPQRADYRQAWAAAVAAHTDATVRTQTAWQLWQAAQLRTDAAWTATTGRAVPRTAAA
jgi:hypothetical protein